MIMMMVMMMYNDLETTDCPNDPLLRHLGHHKERFFMILCHDDDDDVNGLVMSAVMGNQCI